MTFDLGTVVHLDQGYIKFAGQSSRAQKENVPFTAESERVKPGKPYSATWRKGRAELETANN